MTPEDFAFLAKVLRRRSGLALNASKMGLLERRLQPVMRRFGFKDVSGLAQELRLGREALAEAMTEAMTVGETSFFRDAALFARLADSVLPPLQYARRKHKRLRIWSAGCASGPGSLFPRHAAGRNGSGGAGWTVDLIATDLSAKRSPAPRKAAMRPAKSSAACPRKDWRAISRRPGRAGRSPSGCAAW